MAPRVAPNFVVKAAAGPRFNQRLGCVFLDAETSLDNSGEECYCLGEAVKLSKHGEEVKDLTLLRLR